MCGHRRAWIWVALATATISGGGCGDNRVPDQPLDASADAPALDAAPDGQPDTGPILPGVNCAFAIPAPLPGTIEGDSTGYSNTQGASCSGGAAQSADIFYLYELGEVPVDLLVDVTVDEAAPAPYDVVLSARTDCFVAETEIGCVDVGFGEHLELLEVSGPITVLVDGTPQFGGVSEGAFSLTGATRDIVGLGVGCDPAGVTSRCEAGGRCVAGTCVADSPALACSEAEDLTAALAGGPVDRSGVTHAFAADHHQGACAFDPEAGASEAIYRIDLAAQATLTASTDLPGTEFDTVLYLRAGDCAGPEVGCHDDVDLKGQNLRSTLVAPDLAPGTYFLVVDGSSAPGVGAYALHVELTPQP